MRGKKSKSMLAYIFNSSGFNRLLLKHAVTSPEQEEHSSWALLVRSVVTQFCRPNMREAVRIPYTNLIMCFYFLQSLTQRLHQWGHFSLWSLNNILQDQIQRYQKDKDFARKMKDDMSFPKVVENWIAQSGQHQRRNQCYTHSFHMKYLTD